jgi:hypothetical protein
MLLAHLKSNLLSQVEFTRGDGEVKKREEKRREMAKRQVRMNMDTRRPRDRELRLTHVFFPPRKQFLLMCRVDRGLSKGEGGHIVSAAGEDDVRDRGWAAQHDAVRCQLRPRSHPAP